MGLFKKKEVKENPILPELPRLPELKGINQFPETSLNFDEKNDLNSLPEPYSQLPSFPSNKRVDQFSQNTIKHAVAGKPEELSEETNLPEIRMDYPNTYQEQLEEPPEMKKQEFTPKRTRVEEIENKETGPVFIRIDKFEESIKFIKKTKEKISEVEKLLSETKELKEKEEKELIEWDQDLKDLKSKIERIERDLTSKV